MNSPALIKSKPLRHKKPKVSIPIPKHVCSADPVEAGAGAVKEEPAAGRDTGFCTAYIVQFTVYSVHCTVYTGPCTLYTVHGTLLCALIPVKSHNCTKDVSNKQVHWEESSGSKAFRALHYTVQTCTVLHYTVEHGNVLK